MIKRLDGKCFPNQLNMSRLNLRNGLNWTTSWRYVNLHCSAQACYKFCTGWQASRNFKAFLCEWNCGIFSLHSLSTQVRGLNGSYLFCSSWYRIEKRGKHFSPNTGNGKDAKEEGNMSKHVNNICWDFLSRFHIVVTQRAKKEMSNTEKAGQKKQSWNMWRLIGKLQRKGQRENKNVCLTCDF